MAACTQQTGDLSSQVPASYSCSDNMADALETSSPTLGAKDFERHYGYGGLPSPAGTLDNSFRNTSLPPNLWSPPTYHGHWHQDAQSFDRAAKTEIMEYYPNVPVGSPYSLFDESGGMCPGQDPTVPRGYNAMAMTSAATPVSLSSSASYDMRNGGSPMPSAQGTGMPKSTTGSRAYVNLIYEALMSRPDHSMTLQDIYQWFRENTAKASNENGGWKNSVRHNLSMNGVSDPEAEVSGLSRLLYLRRLRPAVIYLRNEADHTLTGIRTGRQE